MRVGCRRRVGSYRRFAWVVEADVDVVSGREIMQIKRRLKTAPGGTKRWMGIDAVAATGGGCRDWAVSRVGGWRRRSRRRGM